MLKTLNRILLATEKKIDIIFLFGIPRCYSSIFMYCVAYTISFSQHS